MESGLQDLFLEEKTFGYNRKNLESLVDLKQRDGTYDEWRQQTAAALLAKTRDYAEYEQLILTPVENMRYASVAWLLGPEVFLLKLPDLIYRLSKQGLGRKEFENVSQWVEDAGIFRYASLESVLAKIQKQMTLDDDDKSQDDMSRNLQERLAQIRKSKSDLDKDLEYVAEQEKKALTFSGKLQEVLLRRVSGQRLQIEDQLKVLTAEENELRQKVVDLHVAEQRKAAQQEAKRREEKEQSKAPYCAQSLDMFDPGSDLNVGDTSEDGTVISIAVQENNLLARHCYIREQLQQYMERRVPIYEWLGMADEHNPILGSLVYQLPIGNIFVTQEGFDILMTGPETAFSLQLAQRNQWMGADSHTMSALWDRHFDVYDVLPIIP
jgi:hypothetical protein